MSFLNRLGNAIKAFAVSNDDDRFWGVPSSLLMSYAPTASQMTVTEDSALTYSAVWAATRLLCGTGSRLPLKLWQEAETEDGTTRTHLMSHPVQRLLKRPNPEMSGLQFRSIMWQWQVNWGNAYAEIEWGRDAPIGLWPLCPWHVIPKRDDDTNVLYYEYNDPMMNPRRIEAMDMLHVPSVITGDGIVGKGVICHARESIGLGLATEQHGANHFGRGAIPKIVIEKAGAKFDDTQRKAFRKEWNDIYGGSTGETVAALGGEATAKVLSFSQEDSQFLETRQHNVEEVARWYGVPPHMLQHLLRATFNNIEEMGIDFVRYSLRPWMRAWEEAVEFKLLPEDDIRDTLQVEHDTLEIELGNSQSRAEFIRSMTGSAVMTRNEGRRMLQMNPVAGGDTFIVQGANVPLDDEGRPESDFAGTAGASPIGDTDSDEEMQNGALGLAKAEMVNRLARLGELAGERACRAAKSPDSFIEWLDSFYADHRGHVEASLSNIAGICASLGLSCDSATLSARWCKAGRDDLLEVSGMAQPAQLADAVATHVQSQAWRQRPAAVVLELEAA